MTGAHLSVVRQNQDESDTSTRGASIAAETPGVSASDFSRAVQTVVSVARSGGLESPVFRSPPSDPGLDRTIRWRGSESPVVSIARAGRPLAAVQADVIEALVVLNELEGARAGRFRRAAWSALRPVASERPRRRAALLPEQRTDQSGPADAVVPAEAVPAAS